MKEALIEIRSNLFSGIEIDAKDVKTINKFKRDFPGVDLAKTLSIAKSQIAPFEFNGLLFSNVCNYHRSIAELKNIDSEISGLNLDATPLSAFSYLLSAFTLSAADLKKVQECCDYLDKRAKIAENKGKTESAGLVRQFSADCRKYLTENQFSVIWPIFGLAYSSVIFEITKIKGGTLGIIQLRDLAEKCFALTHAASDDVKTFQLVMLLIALQCKDFKMEMPIASTSTICPFCDEKVTAGNVCENCREYIKCPGCGAKLTKKGTCSGCGIDTTKLKEYVLLLDEAEKLVGAGSFDNIENRLNLIFTHWKKNERVVALYDSLEKAKDDAAKLSKIIDEHIANLHYKSALQAVDKLLAKNENPSLRQKRELVANKIGAAEQLLKQGNSASDWIEKIDLYKHALQLCADMAEAEINLSNVLIQPPTKLNAEVVGKVVRLSWVGFNSPYVKYAVVRKVDGLPNSYRDGQVITTINADRYDDLDVVVGTSYYYAVYSICEEAFSKNGVAIGPLLLTEDVDIKSFKYDIDETHVGFSFTAPNNSTSIEVYRDNSLIKTLSGATFIDSNLTTDKKYRYKFVALFKDCLGKKYSSKGVEIEVVPTLPPKSVDFHVSELSDKVILTWVSPAKGILELYSSDKPFVENKNDIVVKDKIKGDKLVIVGNSYTAKKDFNGVRYFLPVTVSDNICIAGTCVPIVSVLTPEGVAFDKISERSIEISWQWSKGIDCIKLTYLVEEGREQSELITKLGAPNSRKTITLPKEAKGVEFTIQTQVVGSTGKIFLSEAVKKSFSLQIAKVSFLDVSGGGLFSRSKFTIKVQTNATIPCDLHLLIGEGRTPIDLNHYKSHLTIDRKLLSIDEPHTFTFQYLRNDKNKALIFRLVPADMLVSKSIVITPETKQIK